MDIYLACAHGQHEPLQLPAPEPLVIDPATIDEPTDAEAFQLFTHDTPAGPVHYRVTITRESYASNPRHEFDHGTRFVVDGGRQFNDYDESTRDDVPGSTNGDAGNVWKSLLERHDSGNAFEAARLWLKGFGAYAFPVSRDPRDGTMSTDPVPVRTSARRNLFESTYGRIDGFAYVPASELEHVAPGDREAHALTLVKAGLTEYNHWATGDVYGYAIERVEFDDPDDVDEPELATVVEDYDACGGYYGFEDSGIRDEMVSMLEHVTSVRK